MNIGKLLGVVSPGLSATGLFGNSAQGVGQGALMGMSPMLAMLLHHKKHGRDGAAPDQPPVAAQPTPDVMNATPAATLGGPSVAQAAAALPPANIHGGMDPAKRQQLAQMLLQYGGNMGGFGAQRY